MDLSLPLEAFGEPLVSYAINVPTLDESRFTETQKSILEILTQASIEVLRQDSPTQRNFTRRQFIARTFEGPKTTVLFHSLAPCVVLRHQPSTSQIQ
jgi:hypothetical protein